jgi:hypothetical protein
MFTPFKKFLIAASDDGIEHSRDYSGQVDVHLTPASTESLLEVDELHFDVDFASDDPDHADFLAGAALTNGFSIEIFDAEDDSILDLTDGQVIKTTQQLYLRATAPPIFFTFIDEYDPAHRVGKCVWKFKEPLIIRAGESLRVVFEDDLSGVASAIYITAHGRAKAAISV